MPSDPPLPRGSLEFQRKQAKRLLREFHLGEPEALARAEAVLGARATVRFQLSDALHVIAAEHGHRSWPRFRREFESPRTVRTVHRIGVAAVSMYEERAQRLLEDWAAHLPEAARRVHSHLPDHTSIGLPDARVVIAREYGYPTWRELVADATRARREYAAPPVANVLRATELIADEDAAGLAALLAADPSLSPESLLVRIAQPLHAPERLALPDQVGADCLSVLIERSVDLVGPLNIASCFNQVELVRLLLDAGAPVERFAEGGITALQTAVYHGCAAAGDLLAAVAVVPDALYLAAGAGRVDLLPRWFDSRGGLRPEAFTERPNLSDVGWPPGLPPEW
ncbi:hypothetical protein GCM10010174_32810 [Kutzneria viridogrisea]|uniref:Ankyrin repeat domain-containing protein n=1 Tax=Kutzneria viridogrisea TaxID=47990 RepID=A0ABR6BRK4_9PSEU|nr:hypothetical protein [Kutzneria viridogrisea]